MERLQRTRAGMSSGDMLEELRMVSRNLELEAEDFCSLDSSNIGPEDWTGLAKLIAKRSYDYDGDRSDPWNGYSVHIPLPCCLLCCRISQFRSW